MKDPLFNSLTERFADHAMDVDPGTWGAITGKLAVASGSSLSGLLQEKFAGHEAPVDPQVWTSISSQIGHGAAAGIGSTAGWWTAGIAATVVAGGFLLYNLTGEPAVTVLAEKPEVVAPVVPEQQPVAAEPATQNALVPSTPLTAGANTTTSGTAANRTIRKAGTTKEIVPAPANGPETGQPEKTAQAPNTNENPIVPDPSPEGEKTVNAVLQGIVDNYVTSIDVVSSEPKVPPPSEEEMPSETVRLQHDVTEPEGHETAEPEMIEAVPAAALAVLIPTAFSPNFDGVNDELAVSVQNYQKAIVRIFSATTDRLVFSADNLEAQWNGQVMNTGDRCDPGMYFYALEVVDAQGRKWSKGEVVRLFR